MRNILSRLSALALSMLIFLSPAAVYAEGKEYDLFVKEEKGFEYDIKANDKEIMRPIESKDGYVRYSLEEGKYTIKETKRPKEYKEAQEGTFEIPYKDAEGKEHDVLEITPKMGEKIKENHILSQAGAIGPLFLVATIALIIVGIVSFKKRK